MTKLIDTKFEDINAPYATRSFTDCSYTQEPDTAVRATTVSDNLREKSSEALSNLLREEHMNDLIHAHVPAASVRITSS